MNSLLKEWAPLTDLFNKLPTKVQNGIFSQEVKLTCIDILPEFIALGTNLGIVYWYDRKKKDLERLRCEKNNIPITAIKVISTVDYMLACGNKEGNVSIFQIPKSHPDSIPESLKPKNKQVERYTVSELHKSPITAIEWSKNGMKLFSGDKNGSIILTEIDFSMHICRSMEILNEAYEVVQLSYNQQKLLVSTTYRSIICYRIDKWKVCQVGKKDRKILGKFGGIILQNSPKTSDIILYCTRPGLRLWVSDCEGNVQNTLLFKDLLCKECVEVPIINPISKNLKALKPQKEPSFGILLPFNKFIVTYNNDVIYILDPQTITVLCTMSHFRSVLSVAAHKDEIFVLEEERSVIRISFKPEPVSGAFSYSSTTNFDSITSKISDLSQKIQSTSIISAVSPFVETPINDFNIHTDNSLIMNAEEAKESPIKIPSINPEIEKKFSDIGKQEYSDKILYKQKRKKHNPSMSVSMSSLSSNSSEEKISFTKSTLMNLSTVGVLPDLRSPESIQSDIEYKEKILADVLNLDKIKINLDNLTSEKKKNDREGEASSSSKSPKTKLTANLSQEPIIENLKESEIATNPDESKLATSSHNIQSDPTPMRNSQVVPAFRIIPKEWKLSNIQLNKDNEKESDKSFADWELL